MTYLHWRKGWLSIPSPDEILLLPPKLALALPATPSIILGCKLLMTLAFGNGGIFGPPPKRVVSKPSGAPFVTSPPGALPPGNEPKFPTTTKQLIRQ